MLPKEQMATSNINAQPASTSTPSITRLHIEGFKRHKNCTISLESNLNVIVGDNETGKTSILEAIGLVLTRQYDGHIIDHSIDPYLFNADDVARYFAAQRTGQQLKPPRILIEAYLNSDGNDSAFAKLKGSNNSSAEDCPGISLEIHVDKDYVESLKDYARNNESPPVLPIEFYKVSWRSFANCGISIRDLPFRMKTIDTNLTRVYRGPNKYVAQLVNDVLSEHQRRDLSLAYKQLRHQFAMQPGVRAINEHLVMRGNTATRKKLTVQTDMSSRSTWDSSIAAHLDDLPFDCAGKGEQCRVQLRLAIADSVSCHVLLIEEPENHLSHSNLNVMMDEIQKDCAVQQVIITTHSAYVLNKLGIDKLKLISLKGQPTALSGLPSDTKHYFMKLPGYDTLRLILSKRSILVEGPSDELIVQRVYKDKHGKLPLEDGVDVISVGSLAFTRFLELADLLKIDVRVVTDNDGDLSAIKEKYAAYLNSGKNAIRIFYDNDDTCTTLEPQLLKANSRDLLNKIFGTKHPDNPALLKYMKRHKTDCALKLFETSESWSAPGYIANATA